jgi:hypothetical protein
LTEKNHTDNEYKEDNMIKEKKSLNISCIAWVLLIIIAFVLFWHPQFCVVAHNESVRPSVTLYIVIPLLMFSGYILGRGIASLSGLKRNSLISIAVAVFCAIGLAISGFLYPFMVNEHFMIYANQSFLKWIFYFLILSAFLITLLLTLGLIKDLIRFLFATQNKENWANKRKA